MTEELAQRLVEQGYLSYDDLSVIEPDSLQEMGGLTEEQVATIIQQAERRAEEAERAAAEERRRQKELEHLNKSAGEAPSATIEPLAVPESQAEGESPVAEPKPPADAVPDESAENPGAEEASSGA
jgi:N utilization substance protein A